MNQEQKKILIERKKKLEETRYNKGFFKKFASEETKEKTELDTIKHRIDAMTNTLAIVKNEHEENQSKKIKDMEY